MVEFMNYLNGTLALFAGIIYMNKAARCMIPHWRVYKFMLSASMFIIFVVYAMFIFHIVVDPLIVKFNTTFFTILMICNGILGGSKYGRRN